MFTAVAIGQLGDTGRLRFSDTIGQHLPNVPPELGSITIHQALTHTSGLRDYFRPENRPAILAARTATDLLPLALSGGTEFTPGGRYSYSSSGFVVLGAIVETLTGGTYSAYVRQNIFERAGMTSTSLDGEGKRSMPMTSRPEPGATGESGQRRPAPMMGSSRASPAGGAVTTVADMHRFSVALLRGNLISAQIRQLMWTPHISVGQPTAIGGRRGYGYGFTVNDLSERIVGHGGGSPGVNSHLEIYTASQRSVVALSNYDPPAATNVVNAARQALLGLPASSGPCVAAASS